MKALKIDHDAVIADVRRGMTYDEVAKKYNISVSSASRIGRKYGVHRYSGGESETSKEDQWYFWFCHEWERVTAQILGSMKCTK